MGNSKGKQRLPYASLQLIYETDERSFDSENPIIATVMINSEKDIPAYGVQVSVCRYEKTRTCAEKEDFKTKQMTWQHTFMAHYFADSICRAGVTQIPLTV